MIKKKNILFVVHRYYPYPGGSEYYVQNMAEEMANRGHEVCVLTGQHKCEQGKHNEVYVATDINGTLTKPWDLIVVHGGDVMMQNIVHQNSFIIKSPIAYMLIKPSDSEICQHGMKHSDFLTYSTKADIEHLKKYGYLDKARRIRHGIPSIPFATQASTVNAALRKSSGYDIDVFNTCTFLSCGGFYPNKQMKELADIWNNMQHFDDKAQLIITGYGMPENKPESNPAKGLFVFDNLEKEDINTLMDYSDGYIMNSSEEGFGLVLLEAGLAELPWAARNIAAARDFVTIDPGFGTIYDTNAQLEKWITRIESGIQHETSPFLEFVHANHSIEQTGNDIEDILIELETRRW